MRNDYIWQASSVMCRQDYRLIARQNCQASSLEKQFLPFILLCVQLLRIIYAFVACDDTIRNICIMYHYCIY